MLVKVRKLNEVNFYWQKSVKDLPEEFTADVGLVEIRCPKCFGWRRRIDILEWRPTIPAMDYLPTLWVWQVKYLDKKNKPKTSPFYTEGRNLFVCDHYYFKDEFVAAILTPPQTEVFLIETRDKYNPHLWKCYDEGCMGGVVGRIDYPNTAFMVVRGKILPFKAGENFTVIEREHYRCQAKGQVVQLPDLGVTLYRLPQNLVWRKRTGDDQFTDYRLPILSSEIEWEGKSSGAYMHHGEFSYDVLKNYEEIAQALEKLGLMIHLKRTDEGAVTGWFVIQEKR